MTKLLGTTGSFVGGSLGWAAGEGIGLFTAFVLSIVGTALGLYLGRRLADHFGV